MSGTKMILVNKVVDRIYSLASHQGFKRYFANTSWLFAEKVLRMIVGLFVGVWVARYLGPEKYGLLSYAQSFVGLFTAIATLGLDGIVVRELVKDESRRDELLGTAFWLKVMGGIGVLVFVALAVNFTSNDWYTNFIIFVIASGTVFQAFNVVDMYFQAKVMGKYIAYVNALSLFAGSLFKIYLILSEAPLVYFAWAVVFDSVILALGYIYFYTLQKERFIKWKFNFDLALKYIKIGTPLILSDVITLFIMRIDQVMIKELRDTYEVGVYAASTRLTEAWYIFAVIITNSLFPALLNAKERYELLFKERFRNLLVFLYAVSLLLSIIIQIFSHNIVKLLFGSNFYPTADILVVQIWTSVFVFLGFASTKWL